MEGVSLAVLLCVYVLHITSGSCPNGTYGYQCSYNCSCPDATCDPRDGCRYQTCNRGWSGPTCQKYNKALGKPTSASSIYVASSNAVDGVTTQNNYSYCFHSAFNTNPSITVAWWTVDLSEMTQVHDVTIYFRTDHKDRRNGIQIYIADTFANPTDGVNCNNVTEKEDRTDIPDVLDVTCSGKGRYLVLYTTVKHRPKNVPILDFCEVQIDVCGPGTFGADCDNYCHCDGEVCDYVSGVCPSGGCLQGWQQDKCDTECTPGNYGPNCSQKCSNRNCKTDNSSCDHVTGECVGGCMTGWNGTDCTQKCLLTYGDDCAYLCSDRQCSETSTCDHVTGKCENGCNPGWKEADCTTEQVEASKSDVGVIAGFVVAVIFVAVIVAVVVVLLRRRRIQHSKKTDKHADMFRELTEDTRDTEVDNNVCPNAVEADGNHDPVCVSAMQADENDVEEGANDTYYNVISAPAVTEVSVDQLGERIKELQVTVGGFQAEYQKLSTTFTRSYNDAQLAENKGKNRFVNYYPYDDTRVVLQELPDRPGSDYINASYIDGYLQPKAYIAAQGPHKKTLTDFWRLLWEKNCTRIIMLTNLMEMGRVKCETYWSDKTDLTVGDFNIVVTSSCERAHWVVRELQVTEKKTRTCRNFHQFHFTTWPDHGTPEETALTEFLWLVRTTPNTQDDPLLVHCSAGVGRTGTYIAVDYLLDQALADQNVDVFGCVTKMRNQRKGMIQTEEQYTCVYMTLQEALEFGNTCMEVQEFNQNRNGKRTFKMGRMELTQLIKILNTKREISKQEAMVKGRVYVNGRSDILTQQSQSHLSMKGYLLTEAPSVTTASLFWQLTDQQESSAIIVLPDSHQGLSSFVPSPGDSLDLGPISVRCSTERTINPDLVLLNILRQTDNLPPAAVDVYIMKRFPVDSHSMLLELLEHVDLHTSGADSQPVTIIFSDSGRKMGALLCILSNIVQGLKHDKRIEIYNNMRAMAHCMDQDITQEDVALCYDVASACMESQSIYENL